VRPLTHNAFGGAGNATGRGGRPGGADRQGRFRGFEKGRGFTMRQLGQFAVDFLKNEDGPTAVEYAVMLALIIVVCITAISVLGSNANSTFTKVGSAINVGS
jgi:pilus assembly protein Flp/PilA